MFWKQNYQGKNSSLEGVFEFKNKIGIKVVKTKWLKLFKTIPILTSIHALQELQFRMFVHRKKGLFITLRIFTKTEPSNRSRCLNFL